MNTNLSGDLLPNIYTDNEITKSLQKDSNSIKTARPDRAFGLRPSLFPIPEFLLLDQKLHAVLRTCQGIQNIFMIMEGKSNRGFARQAELQARRGGATIVNAMRCAYNTISHSKTKEGPNESSFIFSATMNSIIFDIWVH